MRPSPLHWFLCLGLLTGAFAVIGFLQTGDARAALAGFSTGSLPAAALGPSEQFRVHFEYRDFAGDFHRFDCGVDAGFAEREEASFGYLVDREQVLAELDQRLIAEIRQRLGLLARHADIVVTHAKLGPEVPAYRVEWSYRLERLWGDRLPAELQSEAERVERRIREELPMLCKGLYTFYFHERGFDFRQEGGAASGGSTSRTRVWRIARDLSWATATIGW